jgi:uncharacterized surface protein with fasciclin (FAS1) repeats
MRSDKTPDPKGMVRMKPIVKFFAAALIAALSFTALAEVETNDAERTGATLSTGTSIDTLAMSTPGGTVLSYLKAHAPLTTGGGCYNHAANRESYTCLVQALKTSGLDQTLANTNNVTLFAPNDAAFKNLATTMTPEAFTHLLNDPQQLKALLSYHVLPKEHTLLDLSLAAGYSGVNEKTLQGSNLPMTFTGADQNNGGVVIGLGQNTFVNGATVKTNNGTVIGIDRVLTPPSETPTS